MSTILQTLRETHPYRLLLLAALFCTVLAQAAAMVMVTRSQVQKAQAHYAAASAAQVAAKSAADEAKARPMAARHQVIQVGYVASR